MGGHGGLGEPSRRSRHTNWDREAVGTLGNAQRA
jgi:hypothetical protein